MDIFELNGRVVVDLADALKAFDELQKEGKKSQSGLSKTFSAVGKGAAWLGKTTVKGLAVGGAAMGALTMQALNLSGELEQNMGGSEAVFGTYAESMQSMAENAFSNMGLSTSDFLGTANKMGALFQGAGFSVKESMNLSSTAMQRAADVASIMGIDTSAAMEAIAGAAKGNFTMMDNLGVAMNDTTLQAYALEKGINKSTQEMTNQEKIGLAMEMFMEKTAYAAGNYAKENQTLAGSLGTAKAALTNFLDGSGDVGQLVDAFSNAATVIVDNLSTIAPRLVTGITDIINQIIPMLPPLLNTLLPVIIEGAVSLINGLVAAMPAIIEALMAVLPSLIAGVAQIIVSLAQALPEMINVIVEALPGVIEAIVAALPTLIPALITGLVALIVALCENFGAIIQPIIDYLPEIIVAVVDALIANLPALLEGLVALMDAIIVALPQIMAAGWEAVGMLWSEWIASIVEWATPLVEAVKTWWDGVKQSAIDKWTEIKTAISDKWEEIKTAISDAIESAKNTLSTKWEEIKTTVSDKWTEIKTTISTKWEEIKTAISDAIESAKSTLSAKWEEIKSSVTNTWNAVKMSITMAWNNIKQSVTDAINGVKQKVESTFNTVKTTVGNIWDGIKSKITQTWTGIKTGVTTAVTTVKSTVSSAFQTVKNTATTIWNGIKSAIQTPIESARDLVEAAIDKIKGFFDFDFSWPQLKLPHFSFSGSWNPFDWPDQFPSIGVSWYAKAMDKPMLLDAPTIFGYDNATGQLMGGGEAGSEVVSGTDTLMRMIGDAVDSRMAAHMAQVAGLLSALLEATVGGNEEMVEAIRDGHVIKIGEREFGRLVKAHA